jgi:hypothetical protein
MLASSTRDKIRWQRAIRLLELRAAGRSYASQDDLDRFWRVLHVFEGGSAPVIETWHSRRS